MKTWVKLYTDLLDDPDIGTLSMTGRGMWMMLLALTGRLDHRDETETETGQLDTLERIAWHLRCDATELQTAMNPLQARGMLDERDGVWFVTNYRKRQARPISDHPSAVSERVKRYRATIPT